MNDALEQNSNDDLRIIPLSRLQPSPTNPRKTFDAAALAELTESVRTSGVQMPLLVRQTITGAYEIIAGERRYRAARAAMLPGVPCIVKDLSNNEVLDLQVIENLHRADVHPIEEAEGYRVIWAATEGLTPEDVARRVGKTVAHVAQRLRLLTLELPAKTLFVAGHLTLEHALLLARLTPEDQGRAVRNLLGANHEPKKIDLVAYTERRIKSHADEKYSRARRLVNDTAAQLKEWIERSVMLKLKGVPWDLADPNLVPLAGACTTCPKRSGANTALFSDMTSDEDVCLDGACYATKHKALVKITMKTSADAGAPMLKLSARRSNLLLAEPLPAAAVVKRDQWVRAGNAKCDATRKGIVVDVSGQMYEESKSRLKAGEILTVCANQKCKVHKHQVVQPGDTGGGGRHYDPVADKRKRDEYIATETPIRRAVFDAIIKAAKPDPVAILREHARNQIHEHVELAASLGIAAPNDAKASKLLEEEIAKSDLNRLARIIFNADLVEDLTPHAYYHNDKAFDRRNMWRIAKAHKVDPDAIAKAVTAKASAAATKAAAKKTAPKKKPTK